MNVGGSRAPAGSYSCGSRGLGPFNSRHRDAGKSGYYTDSDTGLVLCGARFYLPALGRFLTQDPIGQSGGLNLYAYCGDNPINKLDPSGTDAQGWGNAIHAFFGWALGVGPTTNTFEPGSSQSREMEQSLMGSMIYSEVAQAAFLKHRTVIKGDSSFGYKFWRAGSLLPFITTLMEPGNGTEAQVGGFAWKAYRVGNAQIEVQLHNVISFTSFFYQLPVPSWDRFGNGFGPMGNVNQDIYWRIPIPKEYRRR